MLDHLASLTSCYGRAQRVSVCAKNCVSPTTKKTRIPEKLIKNTEFLYPYRRKKLTNQEASVAEVFSNTEITFLALKNHIVAEGMNINSAYKLLAFKMFSFNLMAKINDDLVLGGVA